MEETYDLPHKVLLNWEFTACSMICEKIVRSKKSDQWTENYPDRSPSPEDNIVDSCLEIFTEIAGYRI